MDKYILNAGELEQLKEYIYRHGFREQTTMVEILDHFACKVEEIKTADPQLPFDMAMDKAHKSFGVAGFYPLVKVYEITLEKKYKKIFKSHVLKTLHNPIYVAAHILIAFAISKAYIAADSNGWLLRHYGINDVHILCFVTFIIGGSLMSYRMFQRTATNPIIRAGHSVGQWWWLWSYALMPVGPEPHKHVTTLAILAGVATTSFLIFTIARYRTIKLAVAEYLEIMEIA